jgi:hypothetical protein
VGCFSQMWELTWSDGYGCDMDSGRVDHGGWWKRASSVRFHTVLYLPYDMGGEVESESLSLVPLVLNLETYLVDGVTHPPIFLSHSDG